MAVGGKIPFIASYAVFSPGRNYEQIRTTIAYNDANVKIAGAHAGISVGPDGATHQALEEISLMRILPNMTIIVPCDALEAEKATVASAGISGPVYLRLGRAPMPVITKEADAFTAGKAVTLREGSDLTIFACGQMVYESMLACDILVKEGIKARLVNMHTPKPIDSASIIKAARETGAIVTAEEHTLAGGFGSAVAEVVSSSCPVPVKMIGIRDKFGVSGESEELFEYFGLTPKDIAAAAREALKMKK